MVCSDVSLDDLIDFHAGIDDFDFAPGAALFAAATPADAVYCVRGGAVKMVHLEPSGVARIVRVLQLGDVAGLESVFRERYDYSAIAVNKVRACRIPMSYFRKFIGDHGSLQMRLIESSQTALAEAQNWLAQIVSATIPARTRMARLLLRLKVTADSDRIHRFGVEDMAAILGITAETVSRVVSDFVRDGILVKGGKSFATRYFRGDLPALEKIAREA